MEEDLSGSSPSPPIFRNRYWILRHGRSVPNERGLIVSSLENGTKPEFGLAPQGVEQARSAGESLRKELEEMGVPVDSVKIRYSPFSRTTKTARVVAGVLGVPFDGPSCKAAVELRERYFGPSYELLSHEKYAEVWAVDEADPFMAPEGGESVTDVASRVTCSRAVFFRHGVPWQESRCRHEREGMKLNNNRAYGLSELCNSYCQPWGPTTNLSSSTQWDQGKLIFS